MSDHTQDRVPITAEIRPDLLEALKRLAEKRGVTANTVLEQAIANEQYISEIVEADDRKLLVEGPDHGISELVFESM